MKTNKTNTLSLPVRRAPISSFPQVIGGQKDHWRHPARQTDLDQGLGRLLRPMVRRYTVVQLKTLQGSE
jgi:hypothetical protein